MLGAFGSRWSLVTPTAIVLTIIGLGCGGSTVPADQNRDSPPDASHAGALETDSQIQHVVISYPWWGGWDLTLEDLVLGGTRAGEREAIIVTLSTILIESVVDAPRAGGGRHDWPSGSSR